MSFSGDVKDELVKVLPEARHCQIAEIASVMAISGKYVTDSAGHDEILIRTENPALARKVFTILKKAFNIGVGISAVSSRSPRKSTGCLMTVDDPETVRRISMAVRHQMLLSMECC